MHIVICLDAFPISNDQVLALIKDVGDSIHPPCTIQSERSGLRWKVTKRLSLDADPSEVRADNPPKDVVQSMEMDFQAAQLGNQLAKEGIREFILKPIDHIGMPQKEERLLVEN